LRCNAMMEKCLFRMIPRRVRPAAARRCARRARPALSAVFVSRVPAARLCVRRAPAAGFTLLELLLVLSLAAVLVTAVAGFQADWKRRHQLDERVGALAVAVRFARSYAMVSGARTVVCKSADGAACGGGGYESGWLIFTENEATRNGKPDTGERRLRVRQNARAAGVTIRSNTFVNYIAYDARGRSNRAGRFVACADGAVRGARALVISRTGRLRFAADSDGDGIVEVGNDNIENCLL